MFICGRDIGRYFLQETGAWKYIINSYQFHMIHIYIYMDISGINPSYNYKPRQLTIGHRLERGLAEARVTMYCNSKLKGSVSSIQLRSFVYDLYGTLW